MAEGGVNAEPSRLSKARRHLVGQGCDEGWSCVHFGMSPDGTYERARSVWCCKGWANL